MVEHVGDKHISPLWQRHCSVQHRGNCCGRHSWRTVTIWHTLLLAVCWEKLLPAAAP